MQESSPDGFFTTVSKLYESSVGLVREFINLFLSELQLARESFIRIVALLFVAFIVLITVWLFSLATLTAVLVHFHLSWWLALLIVAGVSLITLLIIIVMIFRLSKNLTLPATRRQLDLFRGGESHDNYKNTEKED